MKPIVLSTEVKASPARVWEVMSDFEHAAERISGIQSVEMLTEGPVRVGTRFRETRVMFGKLAVEEMEVTALEPGRSYTLSADSCGVHFDSTMRAVPVGAGTRLELEMRSRALTLGARVMGAAMGPLMKGAMCKAVSKDLEDIKRAAETGLV
jgi:carbon monoxide dehydrogenase subunit G